ncbi:lamin-like protein [Ipomoea triloba]|uniref:lamin-like protein n=1 Tax=Ipomoea triloba TaxID=35885 RepID=UPI00125CF48C|nr:lamin-like protein [Ipomoea triloba]
MEGSASGVMARNVGAVWLPLVFGSLLLTSALGDRIKVGGNVGWTPNVMNYTEWAAKQHFYVGDWLYFVFDKHYYNVLEVNSSNYETCNDGEFITNITRGGRDVFQLNETRPYYFISSGGYCWNKMKMAINVQQHPTPAPSPSQSNSPPVMSPQSVSLSVVLVMALSAAFMFL